MKNIFYTSLLIVMIFLFVGCSTKVEEEIKEEIISDELNNDLKKDLKVLSEEYNDIVFGEITKCEKFDNTTVYEDDKLKIIVDCITTSKKIGPSLVITSKNLADYDIEYNIKYVRINGITISEPLSSLKVKSKNTYTDTIALLPEGLNTIAKFKEVNELGFLLQVYNAETNELILNNNYMEYINEKVNSYNQDLSIRGDYIKGKNGINLYVYSEQIDFEKMKKAIFLGIDNKSDKNIYGFVREIKINNEAVKSEVVINTPKNGKSYGEFYINEQVEIKELKNLEFEIDFIDLDTLEIIENIKYSK